MDLIKTTQIPDFPSLNLTYIELDSIYYPLTPLSKILGYTTPHSLIQSIPLELKISYQEFHSLYTLYLDQFLSFTPLSNKELKSTLSILKPLWFTPLGGINWILTKNTFTIPRLKESIAKVVGINPISPPRKESQFYDVLCSLLQCTGIQIHRHLYLAGYFVDIELSPLNIVIEYDERNHVYYQKDKEYKREEALKQLGYTIIRVSDDKPPIETASLVFRQILPLIK